MPANAMERDCLFLIDVGSARLRLGSGQHVWLRGSLDTRLTAVDGVAWITFERDAGEVVIPAGASVVVSPGRTALIGPLRGPLTLDVRTAGASADCMQARGNHAPAVRALPWGQGNVPTWPLKGMH